MKRLSAFLAAVAVATCAAAAPAPDEAVFDRSHGKVVLRIKISPAEIDPLQAHFAEIETIAPSGTALDMPALDGFAFDGFTQTGRYEDATDDDGVTARVVRKFRLLPDPSAPRYRLAPFTVSAALPDGARTEFISPAAVFKKARLSAPAGGVPAPLLVPDPPETPLWNSLLAVAFSAFAGLAVFAIAFAPVRLFVRFLGRLGMSAAQRAYAEFDELSGEDLPAKGLHKEHYRKLTSIVREYVEKAYVKKSSEKINASKMTTEEFLRAAADSPYFPPRAMELLRGFLQDADRVKFAGERTTREKSYDASRIARRYVETDAADRAAMAAAERGRAKKGGRDA